MTQYLHGTDDGKRIELGPNEVVVRLAAGDTRGAFSLLEYLAPPHGPSPGRHLHEETDEVIFVLDGTLSCTVAGEELSAGAGDSVWIPRETPHSFSMSGSRKAWFLLWYSPGGFEGYFEEMSSFLETLPPGPPDPEQVGQKAAELSDRYDQTLLEEG